MMLTGHGASGSGDRGAFQHATQITSNPYYSNNFLYRWQEYTRWYMTAWEARKIIDIPVEDALRLPFELTGIDNAIARDLMQAYEHFGLNEQNRRALIQERLYGGCCMIPILKQAKGTELDAPLYLNHIEKGDLLAFNVADISRIVQLDYDQNPFSDGYDKTERYQIDGRDVHASRLIVFDGSPLVNRNAMNLLQNFRYNPAGFGESKLAPLYDSLVRFVGVQQAAYHLVNMASVLLVKTGNLIAMEATDSPALEKLKEIVRCISIYRGAVIDQKDASVEQHSASFGSVPELLTTFAQLLCAGTDIPATRFMSQSPAGMNATGDSDSQNYFNMLGSYQTHRIKPRIRKELDFIGPSLMGHDAWQKIAHEIRIEFPPLWSETAKERAETDRTYAELFRSLYEMGVMRRDKVIDELLKREIFQTGEKVADFLAEEITGESPFGTTDPDQPLSELEKIAAQAQ